VSDQNIAVTRDPVDLASMEIEGVLMSQNPIVESMDLFGLRMAFLARIENQVKVLELQGAFQHLDDIELYGADGDDLVVCAEARRLHVQKQRKRWIAFMHESLAFGG
jgi:hypothetical protein